MVQIFSLISRLNNAFNSFIWGTPMLACFLGVGLMFTLRTKCFQLRHFRLWISSTLLTSLKKSEVRKTKDSASISQFQSLCTALAGTGNRKYRRGCHCHHCRRARSHLLDVDFFHPGNDDTLCGNHTRNEIPLPGQKREMGRRCHGLYGTGSRRKMAGRSVCSILPSRFSRDRKHDTGKLYGIRTLFCFFNLPSNHRSCHPVHGRFCHNGRNQTDRRRDRKNHPGNGCFIHTGLYCYYFCPHRPASIYHPFDPSRCFLTKSRRRRRPWLRDHHCHEKGNLPRSLLQ